MWFLLLKSGFSKEKLKEWVFWMEGVCSVWGLEGLNALQILWCWVAMASKPSWICTTGGALDRSRLWQGVRPWLSTRGSLSLGRFLLNLKAFL